jgi:hypothetical protein
VSRAPWSIVACVVLLASSTPGRPAEPESTRGVGVYPGDPREDFAPTLRPGPPTVYRNLSLHRPARHSSSYDYNLTAQLVTDGIKETALPRTLAVSTTARGPLPKSEREVIADHNVPTAATFDTPSDWVQIELRGGAAPLVIDRLELELHTRRGEGQSGQTGEWRFVLLVSDDGKAFHEAGRAAGPVPTPIPAPRNADPQDTFDAVFRANPAVRATFKLDPPSHARFYRIVLNAAAGEQWSLSEAAFFSEGRRVEVGGPYGFSSAWMSEGAGEQWVSVDLGAPSTFDRVALSWLRRPAEVALQASDDGAQWRDLQTLARTNARDDDVHLKNPAHARYVRVLMRGPASDEGYVLSELEVYGRGGLVAEPKPAPPARADGGLDLAGGRWRLQRDSLVHASGAALSTAGFADDDWLVATVPATVLSSYWNAGALPDPNFGDNQLMISDSFFYADFWYRTEFEAPEAAATQRIFLDFDGVNWKAEVFLNGETLGRIEGAFTRGRFDVTDRIHRGQANALAVRIEKNRTPGSAKQKTLESPGQNGGALGADDPTYHASVGWDWIPTVRGRNIGIWNDVHLRVTGPVTVDDPFVRTTLPLPDTSRADVQIEASIANHSNQKVSGILRGRFGDAAFEQAVTLEPGSSPKIAFDPQTQPSLHLQAPKLWWPNGYGEPNLYDVELQFVSEDGTVSDSKSFHAGVRQFTYKKDGGALKIWINGRRFVGRGGNWGFPETNLRYRGREYDAAVRYHRDMNFTMIRNWVGQTGDDEFYDACDRHGIVVWQDFWLANPWDGPDPDDAELFLTNVRDTVRRIRSHPSIGLYCGRNEGPPPPKIEAGIRAALGALHRDVYYIPNSASGLVSGHGPYWAERPRYYFEQRATTRLHSEMGMPDVVTMDSLQQMMPASELWPPALTWGLHDFNLRGAQHLSAFRALMDWSFGEATALGDWLALAQFVDYDGYRAMFEAQGRNRMGLLLWMSHPAWPSFVWQTYDYYLNPGAGYFGSKKGSEPLHIQWNPTNDAVEVVNYSAGHAAALTAKAELLNMDGAVRWQKTAAVDSAEDSLVAPFTVEYAADLTPVHFIRLTLQRDGETVSQNVYWRALHDDYRSLRDLPLAEVRATTRTEEAQGRYKMTTDLVNTSATPALLLRLSVIRGTTGDRALPALFSDNFIVLMPGESRTLATDIAVADLRGETPRIVAEGFNIRATSTSTIAR